MESHMMFLDCPAYLDEEGAVRCGLPAEVRSRFTMRSTSGPLESVMIRCPSGHWFNAPVEFLTLKNGKEQGLGSAGRAPGSGRDSRRGHEAAGCGPGAPMKPNWGSGGSRPNGAPAYYLGRPASLWISITTRRRRPTEPTRLADAITGSRNERYPGTPAPFDGAGSETACVTPIGCPRRISMPRAGDRPARTGMRSSGTTSSPGTASAVLDAADDGAGERAAAEPADARPGGPPAEPPRRVPRRPAPSPGAAARG